MRHAVLSRTVTLQGSAKHKSLGATSIGLNGLVHQKRLSSWQGREVKMDFEAVGGRGAYD